MAYLQKLVRDSDLKDAVYSQVIAAQHEGYDVLYAVAEVQRNLFSPQEDVFVTLEVGNAASKR